MSPRNLSRSLTCVALLLPLASGLAALQAESSAGATRRSFGRSPGAAVPTVGAPAVGASTVSAPVVSAPRATNGNRAFGNSTARSDSGSRMVSMPSPRASVANIGGNTSVAPMRGETTTGAITRGSSTRYDRNAGWGSPLLGTTPTTPSTGNGLGTPFGGVPVNPGPGIATGGSGVSVNHGPVIRLGRQTTSTIGTVYPQPDTSSEWYKRYQRAQGYLHGDYGNYRGHGGGHGSGHGNCGYNYGDLGPVFVYPSNTYYINNVQQPNWFNQPFISTGNTGTLPVEAAYHPAEVEEPTREQGSQPEIADQNSREQPRRINNLTPEKLHELMIEGTRLFYQGKYNEAAVIFLRVTLADRANVDATLAYAVARFATGDYQISSLAVQRGVRRMPEVVNAAFDVRDRYGDPRQFATHLARLEQFVREHDDNHDGWIVLGFVRHFSGQRELAKQTFERLRGFSRSDGIVADIFLSADPVEAQERVLGTVTTQPAIAPFVTSPNPLPPGIDAAAQPQTLITIE